MAIGKDGAVGRQLRTLFNIGSIRELTDGQLLERFASRRDEAAELAFAALVERHGSMVLRVCRGVLDDPHDSEDAFQATFLVLVAKGRGLWVRDSLGPWLHQVAYRTASCARANAARRRRLERLAAKEEHEVRREAVDDLGRVLHEEINRLPERYRATIVLCDLEGRTHEQAARHLGWPVGTVKSRQARARDRLRDRLARRGFAPKAGLLAALPKPGASLPPALVHSTTLAAVRSVASRAIVPGSAAALSQGVIRTMAITRWLKVASALAALGAAGSGVGMGLLAQEGKPASAPKPEAVRPGDVPATPVQPGRLRVVVSGKGNLEASRARDVMCEVEGGTTIIMIKPEGTRVKQGDVVAELDSAALRDKLVNQRIAVAQAEADFKQAGLVREVAESAVEEYVRGIYPREQSFLKGKLVEAKSGIQKDKARLERTQRARKRFNEALAPNKEPATTADIAADLAIDAQLDDAELGLLRQQRDLELAQNDLKTLQEYTREKTTKKLGIDVERAKRDELVRQSSWMLEQTKGRKFERQIERCTLKAPGDGIVIYANAPARFGGPNRVQIEEGATVRERQKIFSLFDPNDPMRVNVKVPESMVDRIKPGLRSLVRVDAAANEVIKGQVVSVAPMADANNAFASDIKVYTTFVAIEGGTTRMDLRPGLSAQAEILITELDNVLSVPVASVIRLDDKDQVAVKTPEGGVEWREVALGVSNDKVVEVKQGLRPGDLVVLNPVAQLSEEKRQELLRKPPQAPAPFRTRPGTPR